MLEGSNVVFIVVHRFLVATLAAADLVPKAAGLIDRVIELGKGVAELSTVNEKLEPVDQTRIRIFATGER